VALTRATRELGVVYAGELPAVLTGLRPAGEPILARRRSA